MKYPCGLVQDLLPLYHDKACSEESVKIIEQHFQECPVCRKYCESLGESNNVLADLPNSALEMEKTASFRAVKKKMRKKQMLTALIAVALLIVIFISGMSVLKSSEQIIQCQEGLTVTISDGDLIARLQGNQANSMRIKRVETEIEGMTKVYLFFYLSGTKWDKVVTSENVFSEYVLCPADKGAAQIDRVFYYIGDYSGIESLSESDLQKVIKNSVLLWER